MEEKLNPIDPKQQDELEKELESQTSKILEDEDVEGVVTAPEKTKVVIDPTDKEGKVKDFKDLPPFEIIKMEAEENSIPIRDPKPSCKRCYGRGYVGIEIDPKTGEKGMPHACTCIFPPRSKEQEDFMKDHPEFGIRKNRKARRRMKQMMNRKSYKKALIKEFNKRLKKMEEEEANKPTSGTPESTSLTGTPERAGTPAPKRAPTGESVSNIDET